MEEERQYGGNSTVKGSHVVRSGGKELGEEERKEERKKQ